MVNILHLNGFGYIVTDLFSQETRNLGIFERHWENIIKNAYFVVKHAPFKINAA